MQEAVELKEEAPSALWAGENGVSRGVEGSDRGMWRGYTARGTLMETY